MRYMNFIITALVLLSGVAYAVPSGTTFIPAASCNEQKIVFQESLHHSSSGLAGLMVVGAGVLGGEFQGLVPVSKIEGNWSTGMKFTTHDYGDISIDAKGNGSFTYQGCSDDSGTVTCGEKRFELHCQFPPPPPSGFSTGN